MAEGEVHRRVVLHLFGGGFAALATAPAFTAEPRIARLMAETARLASVSQRIGGISAALRGTRYQSYTLIGGPRRPEQFVLRDDAFDCVTYCETVLAAARARDVGSFENALQDIRYRHGLVNWYERNHYFFEWCERNVENRICRWLDMAGAVDISKTVDSQKGLSKRRFAMRVIPHAVFLANVGKLATGDIVGFVSRRTDLDYFHCGFVVAAPKGPLLLRHAAESRHRVLDERIDRFLARYRVRYVTLLRPEEPAAVLATKKEI